MTSIRVFRRAVCGCCPARVPPLASTSARFRDSSRGRQGSSHRSLSIATTQSSPRTPSVGDGQDIASTTERNKAVEKSLGEYKAHKERWKLRDLEPGDWVESRAYRNYSELIFIKPAKRYDTGIFMGRSGRLVYGFYNNLKFCIPKVIDPLEAVAIGAPIFELPELFAQTPDHPLSGLHEGLGALEEDPRIMAMNSRDIEARRAADNTLRSISMAIEKAEHRLSQKGVVDQIYDSLTHSTTANDNRLNNQVPCYMSRMRQIAGLPPLPSHRLRDQEPQDRGILYEHIALQRLVQADSDRFVAWMETLGGAEAYSLRMPEQVKRLHEARASLLGDASSWQTSSKADEGVCDTTKPTIGRIFEDSLSEANKGQSQSYSDVVGTILKFLGKADTYPSAHVIDHLIDSGVFSPRQNIVLKDPHGPLNTRYVDENVDDFERQTHDPLESQRVDYGDLPVYVVDNIDAHELDDGIACERLEDGKVRVHVHVADPIAVLGIGRSKVIQIAERRLESLYHNKELWPMLPPKTTASATGINLGDGSPQKTMVFSVTLEPESDGIRKVVDLDVRPGLVHNIRRTTYAHMNGLLKYNEPGSSAGKRPLDDLDGAAAKDFATLTDVAVASLRARIRMGLISRAAPIFNWPDSLSEGLPHISFDREGKIPRNARLAAETVVAEFMVMANRTAAHFFHEHKIPVLYRTVPPPHAGTPAAAALQHLLSVRDEETGEVSWADAVVADVLRQPAIMSMEPGEHIGIGLMKPSDGGYTYVTSPLRRFPDLLAHIQLHAWFRFGQDWQKHVKSEDGLVSSSEYVAEQCRRINSEADGRREWAARVEAFGHLKSILPHVGPDRPQQKAIVISPGLWLPHMSKVMATAMLPDLGGIHVRVAVSERDANVADMVDKLTVGNTVNVRLDRAVLDLHPVLHATLMPEMSAHKMA